MHHHGVAGTLSIDWDDLVAFKRSFTDPIPGKRERAFKDQGIDAFHGVAQFADPETVIVDGHALRGRHILIASGARPVTGLQRGERMLEKFDPNLVGWLMEKFRDVGIDVHTRSTVTAIEREGSGYRVRAQTSDGESVLPADLVVHAAGRIPDTEDLNLSAAKIASENGRLQLNEYLQSVSNPIVYAAGDAAGKGPPLTPVSSHDAKVVASNILDGNHRKPDYRGVPSAAFTLPPIAAVGLSEAAAQLDRRRVRVNCAKVAEWFTARRVRERVYGYKTLVDDESGEILGAHLVGPKAAEVINLFAMAIRHGLTAEDVKSTMFAYPTGASDIGYML
jgi:glutathione reductase (NADPH)